MSTFPVSTFHPQSCLSTNLLARTAFLLREKNRLVIGYLGGSLTNGAGASNPAETSWRALTTAWFRHNFPSAHVTEIDAGLGGTGSDLGVYRIADDLLCKNPDLVFVEFAVNDSGRGKEELDSVTPAMEAIVRQIWMKNPKADIVFVYTTMKAHAEYHEREERAPSVIRQQSVADHYGIPGVDLGDALWKHLKAEGRTWEDLLPDKVHPNDAGYAIYAEAMIGFLKSQEWGTISMTPIQLPAPLHPDAPTNPRFVDAIPSQIHPWSVEERPVGLFERSLSCEIPGAELKFAFRGNAVGVYWLSADDAGDIEWSIDGSPFQRRTSWSPHGGKSGRPYSAMFADPLWNESLPVGEHELTIRVAETADSRSKGNRVRIAAFIVNEPPEEKRRSPLKVVEGIPDLVAFWDFQEQGGQPRLSGNLALREMNGPIERVKGGVFGTHSARLQRGQFFIIERPEVGALNIHGPAAEVTVVAWVFREDTPPWQAIAGLWDETRSKRQYCLFLNAPYGTRADEMKRYPVANRIHGHVSAVGYSTPGEQVCITYSTGATEIPLRSWQCLAMRYDSKESRVYVNGLLDSLNRYNPFPYSEGLFDGGKDGADFTVGAVHRGEEWGNFFGGQMGGLAIFNRALSDQEIASLGRLLDS